MTTTPVLSRPAHQTQKDVLELLSASVEGLIPMYDAQRQLFCSRMIRTERGMQQEEISRRYTLITLMGLHRLELAGVKSPIAVETPMRALLGQAEWVSSAGDLGLLLWLCALVSPSAIDPFLATHDLKQALEKYADGRERRTMELSWVLSGLAHSVVARPELRERLEPLAIHVYDLIKENRGEHGIFGHQTKAGGVKAMLRGRLGSFADQVYPTYAFAWASRAFKWVTALQYSKACADAICRAQGPQGQWWWHYDSKSGQAVGKYPVYSVHQHGMAPMALFALADVAQMDYQKEIYLGLEWIYGQNELRVDMRDESTNVVWRCIRPTKSRRYLNEALSMLKMEPEGTPRNLRVLHECWPYELGWLLYAFAGRHVG